MTCDRLYLEQAVAALGDDLATQIKDCIEILKTEPDLQRRRVAENRFMRLQDQAERKAS